MAESSPQSLVGGLHILLVEDHDDSRLIFQMVLKQKGHAVVTAASGEQALLLAESHKFDLVISDIALPDISGAELMTILRNRYSLQGIAITGFGMDEDIQRNKAAGFDYCLTKPLDPRNLDRLLAEIMGAIRPSRSETTGAESTLA